MNISALLSELGARGIEVWAENDRLQLNAPAGTLTVELREELRQRKREILKFLDGPAELSFAQSRFWFLNQINPDGVANVIPRGIEMRGHLDVPALERALATLIERHEALRTVFVSVGGQARQVIKAPEPWALPVDELINEEQLRGRLRDEATRPFDLAHGPLFRARLYRLGPDRHILQFTVHHIVSDGWSMGILLRELGELYRAHAQGQVPLLPKLSAQYRDYARWQRDWLQGEVLEEMLGHWRDRLDRAPQVVDLPTDRVRPAVQSQRGAKYSFILPLALTQQLRTLSQRQGVTLFMTLLSGFALLLSRYSGQEDLLIGSPVANRNRAETEALVGCFINTLALRAQPAGDLTVGEFLHRMREVSLDAFEHQGLPFERLVEDLQPLRDMSRNPLLQVMFVLQNAPGKPLELEGLTLRPVEIDAGGARIDLTLSIEEIPDGLHGTFNYSSDLFDKSTVLRMTAHLRVLLEAMVAKPQAKLGELPMLTAAERHELVVEWNATAMDYPRNQCMHQLFEQQVERAPEAVAVVFGEERLKYCELNSRANQLAHHLRGLGVGPEVLVGLCLERSLDLVVGMLGILKAGGAYVPLDPDLPRERLAFMLDDTAAPLIVTQQELLSRLPEHAATVCLDRDWPTIGTYATSTPSCGIESSHLAYVMYTSGSTGKPKGVMVSHGNVVRLLAATWHWFRFSEHDVWTCFHSCAFDFSVWEMWGAFAYGGKLIVVPYGISRDPDAFHALLRRERVTVLNQTPSAFRQLAAADSKVDAASELALRLVIFGGEALEMQSLRSWLDRHGDAMPQLVNMYGITETTVHVTYRRIRRADLDESRGSMIGERIPDLRVHILDRHLQPVPIGIAGEIVVGGAGVARGYLNRPELTAERFVADPFSPGSDARLYRSGDLARRTRSGDLEYLGRIDQQVKLRGFRIELGEIESALLRNANLREAVVILREDAPGDKRLVAYVVAHDGAVSVADLRASLAQYLPDYMVPAAFVQLPALPLTPNGKVDRNALPAPEAPAYTSHAYEPPVGDIEIALAQIWAAVFKLERVGRHDNFFELGGHSLLAISMLERMRQAGLHADVRTLFITPTVAELAAAVGADGGMVEVPANRIPQGCTAISPEMLPLVKLTPGNIQRIAGAVPSGAANIQDIYPLAPLQEGVLFHHLLATEGDPYVLSTVFGFDSRDRLQRYLRALQAVIDRHDILRTAVLWEGLPEPVQVVWRQAPLAVEEISLTPADGDIAQQLRARFDLRNYRLDIRHAPLMRVFIAHDAANTRWVMLRLSHHLSTDHVAQEIIRQEIQAHLLGQADQLPTPLPFRNFVAQARLGISREEHEAFFRKMLGDVDEPTTPFGLTDVQGGTARIAEARRQVDASLARRLRERARALGASAASVCHLAWAQVLARLSGRHDVVFGTVLFGRMLSGSGADRVLGPFVNTLPVRIRIGDESVQESVRSTHALLGQLLRHEHAQLALAQRCSAVAAPAPLFSALLNCRHGTATAHVSAEGLQAWDGIESLGNEGRTNYPFMLSVDDLGDRFALTAKVQSPIDPQRVCTFMHTALEQLVGAMESAPTMPLHNIDVMPESERHQLLVEWNNTEVDYPRDECIHQMFEQQVERAPEAVAVVFEEQQLTYQALNTRANQLAHHLRTLGVGPEVLVGVCLERSLELVIGLLGILKAGGTYVPLDPSYPARRLTFALDDTQAPVLLTQERLLGQLPAHPGRTLCLDRDWPDIATQPTTNPPAMANAGNLAYVIYTSGSTGTPKGVMIEHRGVCNHLHGFAQRYSVSPDDRVLQTAPIGFDLSLWQMLLPLIAGARIVLPEPGAHRSGDELVALIRHTGVTVLRIVPSMLSAITSTEGFAQCASLRMVVSAGEVLDAGLTQHFNALSDAKLYNAYGPTETTFFATLWTCRRDDAHATVSIGRPTPNKRIYILDEHRQPVPIGVAGELYIGGDGLARGYWNQPELTAERFVPDPFSRQPGARLYRTGDRVRYLPDGNLEFLGRLDTQVKLRGFRIELGEIEAVLAQHPQVREAVVLLREDTPGDPRLVAYVVTPEGALVAADLRAALKQQLPDYMIPAAFVQLPALPLTPNGKIDRKALPAAEYVRSETEYRAPRTSLEKVIADIWIGVFNLPRVGIDDNFFDLGGHSLLAIQLLNSINRTLDIKLTLRQLFDAPTVNGLAVAVLDGPVLETEEEIVRNE